MAFKTALETSRGQDVQGPPRHPPLVLMAIILLGTMDEVWTCGWVEGGRRGGGEERIKKFFSFSSSPYGQGIERVYLQNSSE